MDLADDSYFLLAEDDEAAFLKDLAGSADRNLSVASPGPSESEPMSAIRATSAQPERSILDSAAAHGRSSVRDLIRLFLLLRRIRRSILADPVALILSGIAMPGSAGAQANDSVALLSRQFRALRALCPIKPNCLLDSLALIHWLGGVAGSRSLVFGVKLDPFAAHCWVQADSVLLNDRLDHVSLFEPIRVIECSAALR